MISNFLIMAFSLFFAVTVTYVNKLNGNPHKLTLRGKRWLFAVSVVCGMVIGSIAIHFYVNCDLTQANSTCQATWR